jgi:uncharacterized protein (UPF0264 family)
MSSTLTYNRKLLVSVFNAQEAREAVLGGGGIIDSEDPKSALGNISPRYIMDISDAVLDFKRADDIQLSTNIGEDQLQFRRSLTGEAVEKSTMEIAGKSAQAAIGVAISMGTKVNPVSYVKVGVDGMPVEQVGAVLAEVVNTLNRTEASSHCQVMSVLFGQNLQLWNERKSRETVRKVLVGLREFNPTFETDPQGFDIIPYAVNTLRDLNTGDFLFSDPAQVSLATLILHGILSPGSNSTRVRVNELFEHQKYFPQIASGTIRTNKAVIKAMVDVTADSGANAIMIDTSILSKVSNICLVDTADGVFVDFNSLVFQDGMQLKGILPLEDIRFFVDYCHSRGLAANLAGSIESYQAQQLWVLVPEIDQISTRGSSSAIAVDPSNATLQGANTRQFRVIKRNLVRGLAAPEHGGVLNIPASFRGSREAAPRIQELIETIREGRKKLGLPELKTFWADPFGNLEDLK